VGARRQICEPEGLEKGAENLDPVLMRNPTIFAAEIKEANALAEVVGRAERRACEETRCIQDCGTLPSLQAGDVIGPDQAGKGPANLYVCLTEHCPLFGL
jgi:hypothetical protein